MIGKIIMLLILAGFVFRSGKGAFLIAGYNTSSESKKAKIDEKSSAALCQDLCLSSQAAGQ